jgi:hypothetical protein
MRSVYSRGITQTLQHFASAHPAGVHKSWPYGRIHHYHAVCSSRGAFRSAAVHFMYRYLKYLGRHDVLAAMYSYYIELLRNGAVGTYCEAKRGVEHSWLGLPFHPLLSVKGFFTCISSVKALCEQSGFGQYAPKVSWCRVLRNVQEFVSRPRPEVATTGRRD